jgi:hypothetical protein
LALNASSPAPRDWPGLTGLRQSIAGHEFNLKKLLYNMFPHRVIINFDVFCLSIKYQIS